MAASLTKEQLKNELISHGVQPPIQSARKEEFIKLYEQHVAPIISQKGDFSSDEETDVVNEQVQVSNNSLIFNGLDIASLSDEDLYAQLQSFGIPVGPIVDTTRSVYQRKLATLLQNGASPPAAEPVQSESEHNSNGNGTQEDKYSDSEEEQEIVNDQQEVEKETIDPFVQPVVPAAPEPTVISTPEPLTAIRKRITERPPSSLSALPLVDRQGTPTPRPSIHSINSSTQYAYESRRLLDTIDGSSVQPLPAAAKSAPALSILRYVMLLIIIIAVTYITYTYVDVKQIKQVMESVQQNVFQYLGKSEVAEKKEEAIPSPAPDVN